MNFEFQKLSLSHAMTASVDALVVLWPSLVQPEAKAVVFEILTLRQTGKMDDALPVVLYDTTFWKNLINFQHFVDSGMVAAKDLDLFGFADTPRAAWEQLVRRGLTRPGVE